MGRIGLFGGSFNPVHVAHLILAEQAREARSLDKVLFMPVGTPPHKPDRALAPAKHRLRMLQLALEGNEHLEASTLEIEREGPSYTLLTVRHLKEMLGADTRIFLIVGADSIRDLPTWWHAEDLVQEVEIVGLRRPGVSLDSLVELEAAFPPGIMRKIKRSLVPAPLLDVSSTDVRLRVREGRCIRYLVPESVRRYIEEHGLYRSP